MRASEVFASIIDPPREARPAQPGVQERRRSIRNPFGVIAAMLPDHVDELHVPLQVMVINSSVGGVGLRSPVTFVRGRVYRLRIGTGPFFLASRIRIVSARERSDGTFDLGAKFV